MCSGRPMRATLAGRPPGRSIGRLHYPADLMPAPRRLVPVLATVALTLPAAPARAPAAGVACHTSLARPAVPAHPAILDVALPRLRMPAGPSRGHATPGDPPGPRP